MAKLLNLFIALLFIATYVFIVWWTFKNPDYIGGYTTLHNPYDDHKRIKLYLLLLAIPIALASGIVGLVILERKPILGLTLLVLGWMLGVLIVAISPSTGNRHLDQLLSAVRNGTIGVII